MFESYAYENVLCPIHRILFWLPRRFTGFCQRTLRMQQSWWPYICSKTFSLDYMTASFFRKFDLENPRFVKREVPIIAKVMESYDHKRTFCHIFTYWYVTVSQGRIQFYQCTVCIQQWFGAIYQYKKYRLLFDTTHFVKHRASIFREKDFAFKFL